jgi:hypothetical protein
VAGAEQKKIGWQTNFGGVDGNISSSFFNARELSSFNHIYMIAIPDAFCYSSGAIGG